MKVDIEKTNTIMIIMFVIVMPVNTIPKMFEKFPT